MDLQVELDALTQNLLSDTRIVYISYKQVYGLNGLISMGLSNRKDSHIRHEVIRVLAGKAMKEIAGVEVHSAKNLTSPAATFLINLLREPNSTPWRLSEYGRQLIIGIEKQIENEAVQ